MVQAITTTLGMVANQVGRIRRGDNAKVPCEEVVIVIGTNGVHDSTSRIHEGRNLLHGLLKCATGDERDLIQTRRSSRIVTVLIDCHAIEPTQLCNR